MKFSPLGVMIVGLGAIAGILIWAIGYIGLPNDVTHRVLAANPPIVTSVSPAGQSSQQSGGTQNGQPWYSFDESTKTLNLKITTENGNDPMNFNGYSKGALAVTVPVGTIVKITYTNQQTVSHSVGFVPYDQREKADGQFTEAFKGSLGPSDKFKMGVGANQPYTFSFTADKAGQYAMVCGIPGHAAGGMWNEFDVGANAKAPTIKTDKGTVTVESTKK